MIGPLSFNELARASHIKRWHVVQTANQQTLAEHNYNVTVIGLQLFKLLTGEPPTVRFVINLMFHDAAEIRYGDIPTPGKSFIKMWTSDDVFDKMDEAIMPLLPFIDTEALNGREHDIIKLADLIEAACWIKENGIGTHAAWVADRCWRSVVDFVVATGWFDEANSVLSDLGMPYINRSSIATPP